MHLVKVVRVVPSRWVLLVLTAVLVNNCGGSPRAATGWSPEPGTTAAASAVDPRDLGRIEVRASGFRNQKGKALVALFSSSKGFPSDRRKAYRAAEAVIEDKTIALEFSDLPPGTYAVAIHHDENGNYKMDTNFYGRPKEGYGVSNNATRRLGPPKFDDARFELRKKESRRVAIKMKYH